MLTVLDPLRTFGTLSVMLRMVLAVVCGGVIGLEREVKRRTAGFRTHILICLGAAMTSLTSQYLVLVRHYPTDITRLGAQVVAGVGFIGAGAIIVTHRQRVKGLTTAAGLWASAIVGLAVGAGFYEGAVTATVLILLAEVVFSRLEHHILDSAPEIVLYMEYRDRDCLEQVLQVYRKMNLKILDLEITRTTACGDCSANAIFTLRLQRKSSVEILLRTLREVDGVYRAEKL